MLINVIAAVIVLAVLFGVWGGVHLLARRQMGERKLGCRGPGTDEQGNPVCCNSLEPCDVTRHRDTPTG